MDYFNFVFKFEPFPLGTIDPNYFKPVVDFKDILNPDVFPKGTINPEMVKVAETKVEFDTGSNWADWDIPQVLHDVPGPDHDMFGC